MSNPELEILPIEINKEDLKYKQELELMLKDIEQYLYVSIPAKYFNSNNTSKPS